jgi:hypothetical protein
LVLVAQYENQCRFAASIIPFSQFTELILSSE